MAVSMLGVGLTPQATASGDSIVLDIADQRQVFIDGRFLATSHGVELVMHRPRKTGEHVLSPDKSWEGRFGVNNSVLKTKDTYHLWYATGKGTICYAHSKDGIRWVKPVLGLVEYEGSKVNNIVVGNGAGGIDHYGHGSMVFYDPTASADQAFRMALSAARPANHVKILSSPDGIHWKVAHDKVLSFTDPEGKHHLDSQNIVFWDDRINKYVAYMRRNTRSAGSVGRSVARSESDHLGGFLEAQEAPIVLGHDHLDASVGKKALIDYYASATVKYPWAQDAYYMFPQAYFHYVRGHLYEFREEAPLNAGPLHTQFAASRDGVKWERFDRRPFVDLGLKGSFDCMAARVFYGLVPSLGGQEIYAYYLGTDKTHGWNRDENNNRLLTQAGVHPRRNTFVISRLVLRRDGFVSARADYAGGEFTTPVLRFVGQELVLNVDTSATGILQVGILDETGNTIEGYGVNECDRIHTANEINRVVRWQGESDVSKLAGKPVRLRFVFRDADLYAFEFRG
jgi:hypothetical protein